MVTKPLIPRIMTDDPHSEELPNDRADEPTEKPSRGSCCDDSRKAMEDIGDAVRRAWNAGTRDAKQTARDAMPKAREGFTRGLHDLAWGVAYLASFGVGLAREITPEAVEEGWRAGAKAGKRAAEGYAEKQRRQKETGVSDEEPPVAPESGPVAV